MAQTGQNNISPCSVVEIGASQQADPCIKTNMDCRSETTVINKNLNIKEKCMQAVHYQFYM